MKQIIINEWEKIKDSNIFQNIEEFSKLFEEKPNGLCFRKYTSYPWSKENFFFGTYNELLNFYKTSLEVPFYLEKRIGEKFGQLTIKSLIVKFINGKRKIFAKCLCECGNECEKDFQRMIEGHVKSCGNHKGQKKNDLLSLYPDIITNHWDYDKNEDLPENVKITSDKEYWWIDDTGSFLFKPNELTKKQFGTSFHEQCIYFYCKQLFDSTKNRYRFRINNISTETDIFIPEINVAIEYDGVYWHKAKENIDIEKSNRLNGQNIFLIRAREKGLNVIDNKMTKTIICNYSDEDFYKTINSIISTIIQYITESNNELGKETIDKLKKFKLNKNRFEEDKLEILNQYRTNYVNNNITKTCLIKYWDYDKNKVIIPQKVSIDDDIKIWFTCRYGFSKKISVKYIANKHCVDCNADKKSCLSCKNLYCPLCDFCGRYYYRSNPCLLFKKYFYYKIFVEKERNIDKVIYLSNYEKYASITPQLEYEDSFYELHNIFNHHKEELKTNYELFHTMSAVFRYDNMSMKNFKDFSAFEEYMHFYNPYIEKIIFKDFDQDTEQREKFLKFLLDYMKEHKYNINIIELHDSDKVLSKDMINGLVKIVKKLFSYRKNIDYLRLMENYNLFLNTN